MKTKKHSFVITLITVIAVGLIAALVGGMEIDSYALNSTAVTLTATDGTQTVLTVDASTSAATYSWDADTCTLTLNGYEGRTITTNGDINIHLLGNNTLILDPDEITYGTMGLNLDYCAGCATITAGEGGTLNIIGNIKTHFSAVAGSVNMVGGTINIDVTTSSSGYLYGFERSVMFYESDDKVEVNVNIERTNDESNSFIYGFYNGADIRMKEDLTINVDIKGSGYDTLYGFSDIYIYESSPVIVVNLDNNGGDINFRRATNACQGLSLTEGGYVEFNGRVRLSDIGGASNVHTVTTTPADNNYFWKDTNEHYYYTDYIMCDLDGNVLEKAVFEYSETPVTLKWTGGNNYDIPSAKVDDNFSMNVLAGLRGVSTYDSYYWNINVVRAVFPRDFGWLIRAVYLAVASLLHVRRAALLSNSWIRI